MPQTRKQQDNSVRIIAGMYRSRKLEFPSRDGLRPTADRVRETLFNWLQDSIQGVTCLDLFAGSGALGFEALSRGASHVDFVEQDRAASEAIRLNSERLDAKQAHVLCAEAFECLDRLDQESKQYGLVFLDPPFKRELLNSVIERLENSNLLIDGSLVYLEKEKKSIVKPLPENWIELKSKRAGSVEFGLYKVKRSSN